METRQVFRILTIWALLLCASMSRAADIVATGSGNWSSTVPNAPWPSGIVPGTNDDVEVEAPFNVTVDSTAAAQYIFGGGTVTMSPGSTLRIVGDPAGAQGTFQLALLDTSAPSNTVIYSGNPFWAKHQDYYNLVFSNSVATNQLDFYNGTVNSQDPAAAMHIAGDMTVFGKIKVQQGDDFSIHGNLTIGTNSAWDCSSYALSVSGNTTVNGLLLDLDGALGTNYFGGNLTVTATSIGWNVSDVTQWGIGGSLTNNGLIVGKGYGSIAFDGTGVITGSRSIKLPTITVNGTYTIASTITLTTNTPTLNGTLVFDLANTNQIILQTNAGTALYYSGSLNVVNSGAPPASGNTYQLFKAQSYGGAFDTENFPSLPAGLSWVDNLAASGSISVTGTAVSPPVITAYQYSPATHQFTLTWSSVPTVTYSILLATNLKSGSFTNVLATGVPSGGSSTTDTLTVPSGSAGFIRISQP
jgi:hypothetical protein